jgi:hypothetical protein
MDAPTREGLQALAALVAVKLDYLHEREFPDYGNLMEARAETFRPRARALLLRIAEVCLSAGMTADSEPIDLTDDSYRWSLRVWRAGADRTNENCIDVTVEMAEAREYGDDDEPYGVNFGVDIVEWGGTVIGGLSPFNYTPEVWIDARDSSAMDERFALLERANIDSIPDLIDP